MQVVPRPLLRSGTTAMLGIALSSLTPALRADGPATPPPTTASVMPPATTANGASDSDGPDVSDQVPDGNGFHRLCSISVHCNSEETHGLVILPQASLGIVQIPWSNRTGASYHDSIGTFKPSIGIAPRLWWKWEWLGAWDLHAQAFYGSTSKSDPSLNHDDYLWGLSVGGAVFWGMLNLDIAYIERRHLDNGDRVDGGGAFLINFDVTGLLILVGTRGS